MVFRKVAVVLAMAAMCGGAAVWTPPVRGQTAATKPAASAPAKLKTLLKLDTTESAMRSYFDAWQNMEFASILASSAITDAGKKNTVEVYVNFYMWRLALERACLAKFGEEQGLTVLGHVRSLDQQFEVDLKRVLQSPNIDLDVKNRNVAHVFLRREKDRPEGLEASDDFFFRDDYWLIRSEAKWQVDFLKTYNMSEMDEERANLVRFNVDTAFPKIAKKLKELTEQVKKGEIKTADEVKDKITNEWSKIDVPEVPEGKDAKEEGK